MKPEETIQDFNFKRFRPRSIQNFKTLDFNQNLIKQNIETISNICFAPHSAYL